MTDIKRGMMLNLFHECIGLSLSATPKYVSGINTYTGTGIVAFDKIKYLPWKDFKPVAEGKEVMMLVFMTIQDTEQSFSVEQLHS